MAYKDLNDLYQQVLGRAPDAGGAQYWNNLDVNDPNQVEGFKRAATTELAQTHYTPPAAGQPAGSTAGVTTPYDPNGQPNSISNLVALRLMMLSANSLLVLLVLNCQTTLLNGVLKPKPITAQTHKV